MPESGSRKNNALWGLWKGNSAGGLYSTVDDLFRFALALRMHKLLSAHSTQMLLTGKVQIPDGSNAKYAYGFFEEVRNGTRIVGHPGGAPGISTQLDIYLKHDYTVVVLSNYDGPAAECVANKLREMLA
jgi:CubicO group peptidase (beta-lactamase class C family)